MKKMAILALLLLALCVLSPTLAQPQKFSAVYLDTFDTVIQFIAYAEDEATFNRWSENVHEAYFYMHKLFDTYHTYDEEGIVSVCALNQRAASEPVTVDPILFSLLTFCKSQYALCQEQVNVAMGSVLSIWHDYRESGLADPENAALPPMEALEAASAHADIDDLVLDAQNMTVYFADPALKLDVGAVAKGYATEIVAQMLLSGDMPSFIISAGGNVRCGQKPLDGRARWGVSIQDPGPADGLPGTGYMDVLYLTNLSVVTSGDYQRYYVVDGKVYHHIIDPGTLYPAARWRSVTIVCRDSGLADILSTALFVLSREEGQALLDKTKAEAMWMDGQGNCYYSPGFRELIRT